MNLHENLDHIWNMGITVMEKIIAFAVVIGVVIFAVQSTIALTGMAWADVETYYELINRILAIIIGLELVRMLISHTIAAVLELLAFVIARTMLHPDLESLEIMAGVLAFVALMAARHFFTESGFLNEEEKKHRH